MKLKPHDHPLEVCMQRAQDVILAGGQIFQKWWCVGCGGRCMANKPNVLTRKCVCEDCGTITDIEEHGCNYAAVFSSHVGRKIDVPDVSLDIDAD